MAPRVSYFPRSFDLVVLPVVNPERQREPLLALIGTSHPMLPVLPVNEHGHDALATLRSALLGVLRFGDQIDDDLLMQTAAAVTRKLREDYPHVPCWRGGLAVPAAWGLMHLSRHFKEIAGSARGRWAERRHSVATAAERLADLIDIAADGAVSGDSPIDLPPVPTAKELAAAWTRFEKAFKAVTGTCGLVIMIDPPRLEHSPPHRGTPSPVTRLPLTPPSGGGNDAA